MSDARSLGAWMRRQVEGRTAATSFVLRQAVGGTGSSQVESYEGPWKEPEWDKIAEAVLEAAQDDANAVGPGVYSYLLCAVTAADRVAARRGFRVVANDDLGATAGPAESPTATGVLAQLMRHLEAKERLQTAGELRVLTLYEKLLGKLESRVEHLEGREATVMTLFEQLQARKHDRDLAVLKATQDNAERTAFVEKLTALIPHAAAKSGIIPAQGDAELAALVEVMVKKEVPIEALLGALPQEAQILFSSILKRYLPAVPAKQDPKPEP